MRRLGWRRAARARRAAAARRQLVRREGHAPRVDPACPAGATGQAGVRSDPAGIRRNASGVDSPTRHDPAAGTSAARCRAPRAFGTGGRHLGNGGWLGPSRSAGSRCRVRSRPHGAHRLLLVSGLTLFGLVAVSAMLLFYALEDRSPRFVLLFAAACVASSVYGFLQGAWPFGIV